MPHFVRPRRIVAFCAWLCLALRASAFVKSPCRSLLRVRPAVGLLRLGPVPNGGPNGGAGGASPRMIAAEVLAKGLAPGRTRGCEAALSGHAGYAALDQRDRSFVKRAVATTERRVGQIDSVLSSFMDEYPPRPRKDAGGPAMALKVASSLRLGAAELLFLGTPPHAAVSGAVGALRAMGAPEPMTKLANAVLRNLCKQSEATRQGPTKGEAALAGTRPLDNVHPNQVAAWAASWGPEVASKIASQMMEPPALDLTLCKSKCIELLAKDCAEGADRLDLSAKEGDAAQLADHFADHLVGHWAKLLNATALPTGSLRCESAGAVDRLPSFADGAWFVQDASAALPAAVLLQSLQSLQSPEGPEDRQVEVLVDMCAAPGGKTAQLADALKMATCRAQGGGAQGGRVVAVEVDPRRAKRLVGNLRRLGLAPPEAAPPEGAAGTAEVHGATAEFEVWVGDGRNLVLDDKNLAAGVLLDVPCTATGTGRRRPDVLRKAIPPAAPTHDAGEAGDGGRGRRGRVGRVNPLQESAANDAAEFAELLKVQFELAEHAARNLLRPPDAALRKRGGVLVYSTCSLLEAESEDQARRLLELHASDPAGAGRPLLAANPIAAREVPKGFEGALTPEGWLRVVPGSLEPPLDNVDGFFVARFTRAA